jgi:hypothetical protein
MHWTPLPKGAFTGIAWARPDATAGFDPYLVWAEADDFAGYGGRPPKWMPLLIELAAGVSIAQLKAAASDHWLYLPPIYTSRAAPGGLRFCTARVRPRFFKEIRPGGALDGLLQRFEMGLPAGSQADDPNAPVGRVRPAAGDLLTGKVMGLIDGGLAFAHADFLRNGKTRIKHFWRQDRKGRGNPPAGFGYGHEISGAEIDRVMRLNTFGGMVDETRVYSQLDMGLELDKRINHGTHVLDIAAGPRTVQAQIANVPPAHNAPPSWAPANDDASRCDIVAVQLDWDTVKDSSGGSMNVHILDGLMYILSRCASGTKIAVNLSWGTLAGPHDGSSVLEAAMDQLIALIGRKRLQIILPASNSYQARTHANATIAPGGEAVLHWLGQPDDVTQSFLELWLPAGAQGISIEVTPPGRGSLPALRFGQSGRWVDARGKTQCALIYPKSVAIGTNGTCALLALSPTFSFEDGAATVPSGPWTIRLRNTGRKKVPLDAYIERDDEIIGVRTGARQTNFQDRWYDTSGNPGSFVDHPDNPSLIRRSGSFNSIATGKNTVSVGGTRIAGPLWALYSPRKPDPVAAWPQRPGVVKVPERAAPSDENQVLLGLDAASTRSGGFARLVGTSDAAPQVTRKIFNAL